MISEREKGLFKVFGSLQILLATFCFLALYLASDLLRTGWDSSPVGYFKVLLVIWASMVLELSSRSDSQQLNAGQAGRRTAVSLARRQSLWLLGGLAVFLMLSRDQTISRGFVLGVAAMSFPVFYFTHRHGREWIMQSTRSGNLHWRMRALVIGTPGWCSEIESRMGQHRDLWQIDDQIVFENDHPPEDLVKQLAGREFDLLIFSSVGMPDDMVGTLLAMGDRKGFRCWIPLRMSIQHGRNFTSQNVGGITVLTPPALPLANTYNRAVKRLFDIFFSLGVLAVLYWPAAILVAALHRRYSPGPLLYRQKRIGENGKIFEILKFRTMCVENDDESRQASPDDERVFRGARWLRKFSIDELPQFLNVFRGDMSVIGPRPHMIEHEREFEQFHELYGSRRYVKPGISGLAQVRGFRGQVRRALDVRGRARYDLLYVKKWCLLLDVRLTLLTAWQLVRPHRNAF